MSVGLNFLAAEEGIVVEVGCGMWGFVVGLGWVGLGWVGLGFVVVGVGVGWISIKEPRYIF